MDTKLRSDWLSALRSGKYQQGTGQMRSLDDKYCCLGVLADLLNSEAWSACESGYVYNLKVAGFIVGDLSVLGLPQGFLAHMNDNGESFSEIADYIERKLPAEKGA